MRSRRTAAVVLGVIALGVPASALATPAVDEYVLDIPDAGDDLEGKAPQEPAQRPARIGLASELETVLANVSEGAALRSIATSTSLGAPDATRAEGLNSAPGSRSDAAGDRSLSAIAADIAGEPESLAIIAALTVIAGGAIIISRRRLS